jgi:hypothetical protein
MDKHFVAHQITARHFVIHQIMARHFVADHLWLTIYG